MIELACPHCGASQRLRPELAGERVACGVCGKSFKVPLAAAGIHKTPSEAPDHRRRSEGDPEPEEFELVSEREGEPRWGGSAAAFGSESRLSGDSESERFSEASLPREGRERDLMDLDLDDPFGEALSGSRTSSPEKASSSSPSTADPFGISSPPASRDKAERDAPVVMGRSELEPLRLDEAVGSGGSDASEIRVCCPVCESVTWVKPHKAGTRIACSDCGTSVEVPRVSEKRPQVKRPAVSAVSRWKEDEGKAKESGGGIAAEGIGKIDPKLHVGVARKWGESKPQDEMEREGLDPVEKVLRQRKLVDEPLHESRKSLEDEARGESDGPQPVPKQAGEWIRQSVLVFATPSAIGAALVVGFAVILSEAAMATVIWGAQQENAANFFTLLGWVVSFPIGLFWLLISSVVGGTVVADTANGSKRVESWPPLEPMELLRSVLPFLVPLIASLVPAVLLTQMVINVGAPWWVVSWIVPLVRWMLLPVFLLSSMRAGSPWHLIHRPTIGLWKASPATRTFYVLSGLVVLMAYFANTASLSLGLCAAFPAGILQGFFWVLHARLIGLLLRNLEAESVD